MVSIAQYLGTIISMLSKLCRLSRHLRFQASYGDSVLTMDYYGDSVLSVESYGEWLANCTLLLTY